MTARCFFSKGRPGALQGLWPLALAVFSLSLRAGAGPAAAAGGMTARSMSANPSSMSGKTIRAGIGEGLNVESAAIKNAAFSNSKIWNASFKSVTFESCRRSQAHFWKTAFENLTFRGEAQNEAGGRQSGNRPHL